MASDKEGDRSLSGGSYGGREGTGGGPGGPAGTERNSGTNSGGGKSGGQGSGTSSSWGGKSTGGGSTGSKSGSTSTSSISGADHEGAGGGPGGPRGATSARGVTSATASAISRGVAQGLATALRGTTGFTSDFNSRRALSGADLASRIGPTNNGPPTTRDIAERTAFNVAQANAADMTGLGLRTDKATPTGFTPTFPARTAIISTNRVVEKYLRPAPSTFRAAENQSMADLDAMGPPDVSPTNAYVAQSLANAPRGLGTAAGFTPSGMDDSVNAYNREQTALRNAQEMSAYNAQRAAVGQQARAIENESMSKYRTGVGAETLARRDAIGANETGGKKNPYSVKHADVRMKNGRIANAYGKYGIMDFNIGPWTKKALGKAMTPQEFLANPQAQDTTFDVIFGGYVREKGLEKAARSWLGSEDPTVRDRVTGISTGEYGKNFMGRYEKALERRTNEALNAPELGGTGPATASPPTSAAARGPTDAASAREAGMIARNNAIAAAVEQGQDRNSPAVQAAANLAQREAERTWSPTGFPPAPPGSPDDVTPDAAGGSATPATKKPATSAAGTRPPGTGPATGPWGDDKLEPVKGPKAPEPLSPGQQLFSFGAKTALGLHPIGQAVVALDLLAEGFTGQGFIDALIARSDNPRTGGGSGSYRSLTGETASASGRDTPTVPTALTPTPTPKPPETKPIATVNNVVEKYIEDTTKRPTPAQRWNYEDDAYSEYA